MKKGGDKKFSIFSFKKLKEKLADVKSKNNELIEGVNQMHDEDLKDQLGNIFGVSAEVKAEVKTQVEEFYKNHDNQSPFKVLGLMQGASSKEVEAVKATDDASQDAKDLLLTENRDTRMEIYRRITAIEEEHSKTSSVKPN